MSRWRTLPWEALDLLSMSTLTILLDALINEYRLYTIAKQTKGAYKYPVKDFKFSTYMYSGSGGARAAPL